MPDDIPVKRPKVFVIGIDGGTFDIIQPLVLKGKLPNIARLMKDGVYGKLRSTIPTVSPVAWTSFATGKNPGKHGIFDYVGRNPGTYTMRFNNASCRKAVPILNILSDEGKTVGVLNVTMSYPPDNVKGFMVSGIGTGGTGCVFSSPPELCRVLQEKFGRYIFANPYPFGEGADKFISGIYKEIDYRFETLSYLMEKYPWDFLTVVFIAADGASHFLWKYKDAKHPGYNESKQKEYGDAIDKVYEKLDETIGKLLEQIDEETVVIILSDHGFGPLYKAIHLNNLLKKYGYLKFNDTRGSRGINDCKLLIKLILNKMLPGKVRDERRRAKRRGLRGGASANTLQGVNWLETKAFFEGTVGNLFLNMKGREPAGTVRPGKEAEDICNDIINILKKLEDPETGETVIENVYKKEDIFEGDCMESAPELVVVFREGYAAFSGFGSMKSNMKTRDRVMVDSYKWSADHEINGILIMKGPHIVKGLELQKADIVDVAPTILHLMGIPVPEDMDGKVFAGALDRDFMLRNTVKYTKVAKGEEFPEKIEGYSEEDAQKVKERLKQLGYLE